MNQLLMYCFMSVFMYDDYNSSFYFQSKSKNELPAVQNFASENGQMGATVPVFAQNNTSSRGPAGLNVQSVSRVKKSSASTTASFTADLHQPCM